MPHNLYLHSSIVQTRDFGRGARQKREAVRFATIDSTIALGFSLFVNAAILILGAAAFHHRGLTAVADITQAYQLLTPVLGAGLASTLFAAALLCSGQNSTLTGTLAGQVVMEGFLHLQIKPWLRRLITRSLAIIPAALVIGIAGEHKATGLLILSQVILSFQLPFALVPLVQFTNDKQRMGEFTNSRWVAALAWFTAALIIALNALLIVLIFRGSS
jgi:manganese transport protein